MATTGNGATIAFASSSNGALRLVRIGEWTEEIPSLDDNDLSITAGSHMQFCRGSLIEHGPIDIDVAIDPDTQGDFSFAEEQITITYPPGSGQTNGATLIGLGWLQRRSSGTLESNTRAEGSFAIHFKGGAAGVGHTPGS